jgi:hypothetical protein
MIPLLLIGLISYFALQGDTKQQPRTEIKDPKPQANLAKTPRQGRLDLLDQRNLIDDLKRQRRLDYWLDRLVELSIQEIPVEAIPEIIKLAENAELPLRGTAQKILDKNPFSEIEENDDNPFRVVD